MTNQTFHILGRVIDRRSKVGISGLQVQVWDKDKIFNDLVGSATTDANGRFHIQFDEIHFRECFLDRRPDLFFKVFRNGELIKSTEDSVVWNVRTGETQIVIEVEVQMPQAQGFVVQGTLQKEDGTPSPGIVVKVIDKDLPSAPINEELLFETRTDAHGHFRGTYNAKQFLRGEKKRADLVVRAFTPQGTLLGESEVIFNAKETETINLTVRSLSEFEKLLAYFIHVLQGVQLADLTDEDISFLIPETGLKQQVFVVLRRSAQLGREINLPTEVFYALARRNFPLDLDQLLDRLEVLRGELEGAIQDNIIPPDIRDSLAQILERFEQLRLERSIFISREVIGQLITQGTNAPVAGFTVHSFDLGATPQPQDLGIDITDARGIFSFSYIAPRQITTSQTIRLQIATPQGQIIYQTELQVQPEQTTIQVQVPATAIPQPTSPPIEEVAQTLNLQIPQALRDYLVQNNIRTLADIRRAGGLSEIQGLPDGLDLAVIRTLDAHANLSLLSANLEQNAFLINRGYTHINAIAKNTRAAFVTATHEQLGDFKAAQLHAMANTQTLYLSNIMTGLQADRANGFPRKISPISDEQFDKFASTACQCRDCEAAVSPAAYLADLLDYTVRHVERRGVLIDLVDLATTFHQPFGDLPTSCKAVEEPVRQVRLCIEVLRRYLRSMDRSTPEAEEQKYRVAAYTALLTQLGTSFEELRLARTAEEDARKRLADRLGIDLTHLSELLLQPTTITEQILEQRFGLMNTSRDPLAPPPYPEADGPDLQKWRLERLRTSWFQEDFPEDTAGERSPLIDPDVIGLEYLKNNLVEADPAYRLWNERFRLIDSRLTSLRNRPEIVSLADFDTWLSREFGISLGRDSFTVAELTALEQQQTTGNNISARLEQLKLNREAFTSLLRVRKLVEVQSNPSSVLLSEWEDVYSILVQVEKRRRFVEWRQQEKDAVLSLSPDFFKIPEPPALTFPPPEPAPLPTWRATWRDRRNWEDTLKTRIEQEKTLNEALKTAVSTVEGTTLTMLRDALILATDAAGTTLEAKAKVITDKLLIDAKASGCQKTTRIGQAIETIQQLLWSLRTGQLQDTYPELRLDADNFDEEWEWIGSFAPWRAAMFVFLYPENILTPSLLNRQTPALRQLVSTLRQNRRLTPEQACEAAQVYSDYFRDVCNLEVEATCRVWTSPSQSRCGNQQEKRTGERDLLYMFARSTVTNIVYWSAVDLEDRSDSAQQVWALPLLQPVKANRILGATPCKTSDGKRLLLVFLEVQEGDQKKFVFLRYSLETLSWEGEPNPLEPPSEKVLEITVAQLTSETYRPIVAFVVDIGKVSAGGDPASGVKNYRLYLRQLNSDCTDWAEVDSNSFANTSTEESAWVPFYRDFEFYESLIAVILHDIRLRIYLLSNRRIQLYEAFLLNGSSDIITGIQWETSSSSTESSWSDGIVPYHPVSNSSSNYSDFIFTGNSLPTLTWYREIAYGPLVRERVQLPLGIKQIARHSESRSNRYINDDRIFIVCRVPGEASSSAYYLLLLRKVEASLLEERRLRVAPTISSSVGGSTLPTFGFDITEQLTQAELQQKRSTIATAFLENQEGGASNLIYLEEAFYFRPIQIALQLQQRGHYTEALDWFRTVYDYSTLPEQREIYPFEVGNFAEAYQRSDDWLLDPLNPHAIASTRPGTYLRFTLMSLVRCLLNYADAEFTRDTAESIPRARTLYMTALELLETPSLKQQTSVCENQIGSLIIEIGEPEWRWVFTEIKRGLSQINDRTQLEATIGDLRKIANTNQPIAQRLLIMREIVAKAVASLPAQPTLAKVVSDKAELTRKANTILVKQPAIAEAATKASAIVAADYLNAVSQVTGINTQTLENEKVEFPWLRQKANSTSGNGVALAVRGSSSLAFIDPDLAAIINPPLLVDLGLTLKFPGSFTWISPPSVQFCIPPNPVLDALRLRAELNLYKIRTCRNIAGIERQLDPYAAPTDTLSGLPQIGAGGQLVLPGIVTLPPTQYRYSVLIERTKQLVQLAAQVESAMLSSLEKRDAEYYNLLKARQDVQLSRQGVQLQTLRVREAENGVKLAELQHERSQIQLDHYQDLLDAGWLQAEIDALIHIGISIALPASITVTGPVTSVSFSPSGAAQSVANFLSTIASYERRRQEWEFQRNLANQDVLIGNQGVTLAQDQVRIVGQEHKIAETQADYAKEVLDFLSNKFTNVELYDWMSGVLEGVYSFFLQQATAVAKQAEAQLAFERQEVPPAIIQADYWEAPTDDAGSNLTGRAPDRRGLTGSSRLLEDIYSLDQYAFDTDKRKLQLTKTISLARLDPFAFQQFRETGILRFNTPMELFDRDFPGHYLRLIKRVRVSVIALIPPTEGIRATLSTLGTSRVVIGGDIFQKVPVQRPPESVALTSPRDATGVFELQEQSEMLLPFEGMGVDASWEFRMLKAANLFDYNTIADVLLTIEYTDFNSFEYRQQIIRQLDTRFSGDRPFSFRNQFADAWYDLNNPDQTTTPMVVKFETRREDFPPNIENLLIQQVVLYCVPANGAAFELRISNFSFTYKDNQAREKTISGSGDTINGIISTRRSNAPVELISKPIVGQWMLDLSYDPATVGLSNPRDLFENEQIEDILFVITYSGQTQPWI
ncbi:MAG: hypothetical protein RMY34_29540 [Aulosira sp. DedQUE10]|nr:hypothetical protein [Aulosira sp. DedQUE10]